MCCKCKYFYIVKLIKKYSKYNFYIDQVGIFFHSVELPINFVLFCIKIRPKITDNYVIDNFNAYSNKNLHVNLLTA